MTEMCTYTWRALRLVIASMAISAVLPTAARADTFTVICGTGTYPTITSALNAAALTANGPQGPHLIFVSGDCPTASEGPNGLQIVGFSSLTIGGALPSGGTISGSPKTCTQTVVGPSAVTLTDSIVRLRGAVGSFGPLLVTGGQNGVTLNGGSSLALSAVTIQDANSSGVFLNGGTVLTLQGAVVVSGTTVPTPNTIQNNCGFGVTVTNATLTAQQGNTIQGNGIGGVNVLDGYGSLSGGSDGAIVIQNNGNVGVSVRSGSVTFNGPVQVQQNGTGDIVGYRAGVLALLGGRILVQSDGLEVVDNTGAGLNVDVQSTVSFVPPSGSPVASTITGNSAGGLLLGHLSAAQTSAGTSVTGNTGPDVTCDSSSILFGDTTGITKRVGCGSTK